MLIKPTSNYNTMPKSLFTWIALLLISVSAHAQYDLAGIRQQIDQQAYGAAKARLAELISKHPKEPALHYWLGRVYFEEHDNEMARSAFEAGIRIKNNYYLNRVGLSRVMIRSGQKAEALALLKKVREDITYWGKPDKEVDYDMAQAYLEAGEFKEAEVLLYQLQAVEKQHPRSYIALGDYYMAKGIGDLALNQYEQALQRDSAYIPAYTRIGQLKIEAREYEVGARMLSRAIALDPAYAPSYRERGELYFKAKQYDKAKEDYRKYVALTGNDLGARHRLAEFLYLSENYAETITELEAIDTTTNVKLRLLGYSYLKTDRPEEAIATLDRYFGRMKPAYTIATDDEMYGRALMALGKYEEADAYFAKAISRDPEHVVIYRDLARDFKEAGEFALEARYRTLYVQAKPEKNHSNYYNLGIAHYRADAFLPAFEAFETAASINPNDTKTYNWLMRTGNKLEAADTTSLEWFVLPAAEKVMALIGEKPESELDKADRQTLAVATQLLAFYHFDPKGEGVNDCRAAQPFLKRALTLDPQNAGLLQMRSYCESLGGN